MQQAFKTCHGNYWNASEGKCESALVKIDSVKTPCHLFRVKTASSSLMMMHWLFSYSQLISGLNIYDILEPCYHGKSIKEANLQNSKLPKSFKDLGVTNKPFPVRTRMLGRAWPLRAPVKAGRVPLWQEVASGVPCMVSLKHNSEKDTTHLKFLRLRIKHSSEEICCLQEIHYMLISQYLITFSLLNLQSDEVATAWLDKDGVRSAIHAQSVWS